MKTYEFHPAVNAALTDTTDGSMKQVGNDGELIVANAASALERFSSQPSRAVRVRLDYDSGDFTRYREVTHHNGGDGVTRPSSITADALFTTDADTALLLPLADCVGAVLYDQTTGVLGMTHLGRHNLEQNGGRFSVDFMRSAFATRPSDVKVLLSAAASRAAYPLYQLENKGLHEVAIEQLMAAGILQGNITVDQRDTTTDPLLYSHSQALKGIGTIGRHAMIALLKP